jgi:centromeric protein E
MRRARSARANERTTGWTRCQGNQSSARTDDVAFSLSLSETQEVSSADASYAFDRVFDESTNNKQVYEATTSKIVRDVLGGMNGTVFAYGQTSSGKTHTMHGSADELGVIPLAIKDVFDAVRRHANDREFLIRVSYLEIYNEKMVDLLAESEESANASAELSIREDKDRGTYVHGLKEEIVTTPSQVLSLLDFGTSRRHVGATNMNAHSSRSHTIFRMIVESRAINASAMETTEGGETQAKDHPGGGGGGGVLVSTLNLVDLAGSERVSKTGAEGQRAKEGAHINKSLMTLGVVINKLSEGVESKGGHIPYRDSKLTRILQPALGGNSKTAIVCAMTPATTHCDESHSTLRFASRAKRVVNKAMVNEVINGATNAMVKRQQREIAALKARLEAEGCSKVDDKAIEALRRRLAEADREKQLMALAIEDGEEKAKERESKIAQLEKRVKELERLCEKDAEPHTDELAVTKNQLVVLGNGNNDSLSAMTPDTLAAMKAFEAKIASLERDRNEIKSKLTLELEESEKRREGLERERVESMKHVASLKAEIAEITAAMVDDGNGGAVADVQILLDQAKRGRQRAEDELSEMKEELFNEKTRRACAEANVEKLRQQIEEEKRFAKSSGNHDAVVIEPSASHVMRKQLVKQSETISILEARVKESEQMLDEAIKVYEEEVARNNSVNRRGGNNATTTTSNDGDHHDVDEELSKKCATYEKKYALAKAAFSKLESEKKSEAKELKRQMHKLTEVYARLRDKVANPETFDKVKASTELKYDLQALERKRQVEKKALLAKIAELESKLEGSAAAADHKDNNMSSTSPTTKRQKRGAHSNDDASAPAALSPVNQNVASF